MSKIRILVASLLLVTWATLAHAAAVPGLFNTGVDNFGVVLTGGAVDPHYALIVSADAAHPGPDAIVASVIPAGYWLPANLASMWIAPAADENWPALGTALADGDYVYRLSFDLSAMDLGSVSVSGAWATDNSGTLRLNGAATGYSSVTYNSLSPFTLSSGFVPGVNHLDFVVSNWPASGSNPTGLRVEGISGTGNSTVGVEPDLEGHALELTAPFPNPAHSVARFFYALPKPGRVRLAVHDLAGRTVRMLIDREEPAGRFAAQWDGRGADGTAARAGIYLVDLEAKGGRVSRRIAWIP